ncbi:ATP-binding region ATPase domain protein [Pseudofrankia inefficax]|uniref:histidine kinase n=1 Tax=Pseudofrankia inefficax (strain DSM 45817 / CECT 9037 / DDB 130130 / EuI1c) TaxID=298654 RepID=E3J2M7_PSEI1|nr:ATP-binding region ATPase domain protein [Pseudofrankia inefficax]
MRASDLHAVGLFDGLTDQQLEQLLAVGVELRFEAGQELFRHGDPADFWWVLLDGAIELVRRTAQDESVVGQMASPGRWAGGFRAWDARGVYLATGRARTAGRLFRVAATDLRALTESWFPFGMHIIEGLFGTARSIESAVRQRDALVTLGTLAAGLAHEINNPAAAAARAVAALKDTCDTLLSSLRQLADGDLAADQFRALDQLRVEVAAPSAPLDPLDLSDLQEDLGSWLTGHGVSQGWSIAPVLAKAGIDVAWCERVADVVTGPALAPALVWVASTFAATDLLGVVSSSTRRVSELVGAVRSYSQLDRASMQDTDLVEGLESTLVMLGHKMRGGLRVERRFGQEVPRISAYAGELNQAWTNLIDNALDAMDGAGTLRLTTRLDGDAVVVEVGDTGPGMPPEVRARAFEAFFTTKDVGKGTGLGLDIVRRIIEERHGGTIGIDSRPGDTVVWVRLPIDRGSSPARP